MNATNVRRLDTTQSTNADGLKLAQAGERGPLWIVAREQRGGRGRRGREWHSPPGNLYATLLLTAPCAADVAPQLGFVAGVALVKAIAEIVPEAQDDVRLKWPNDVLCNGAKLAGILVEATRIADGTLACVVGIGVNCRSYPSDIAYPATSLSLRVGTDVSPQTLFDALERSMTHWLSRWNGGADFDAVREAWLQHAAWRGEAVRIAMHDRVLDGIFETIDPQGRLMLATADGRISIDAGDVQSARGPSALVSA